MVKDKEIVSLPRTLKEFKNWEPNDGYKHEWNDGELIKFTGMNNSYNKVLKWLKLGHNGQSALALLAQIGRASCRERV